MNKLRKSFIMNFAIMLVAVLMLSSIPTFPVLADTSRTVTVEYYNQDAANPRNFTLLNSSSKTVEGWGSSAPEMEPLSEGYSGWYYDEAGTTSFSSTIFGECLLDENCSTVKVYALLSNQPILAKDVHWSSEKDRYNDIMSSQASKYYLTCQPDSALVLETNVNITADMLSPNYTLGVVDLPRLSSSYYYEVSGNTAFYLSSGVYPSLCWTPAAKGSYCTLTIRSEADASSLFACTITLPTDLEGVDVADFKDCSANLTSDLVACGEYYEVKFATELYDASAHKCAIIMPQYQISPKYSVIGTTGVDTAVLHTLSDDTVKHNRAVLSVGGSTTSSDIKEYAQYYQSNYFTKALLFQGCKADGCTYDNNTGMAVTRTTASDTEPLYYFIATNDKCYWGEVVTDTTSADELTTTDANAETATWLTDEYNSLLTLNKDIVSYDDWWGSSYVGGLTMRGKYDFLPSAVVTNKNIYANTLMFAGVDAHLGTLSIVNPPRQTTISYYYKEPDATSWTKLGEDVSLPSKDVKLENLASIPTLADFKSKGWFTDTNMQTPVSLAALANDNADTNIRLYSGYDYVGGEYTVTFYNDVTGAKTVSTFEKRELPTLPKNPDPQAGYAFRCWRIVNDFESVGGTDYDPTTFKPERDTDYKFKTAWDVKGIVTKVLTDKTSYYLGETVDKSLLEVCVQTDNAGTLRVLEDNEYTMSGSTITKEGLNQFTITYTATGATGICEVTGMADVPLGISAIYTGGDVIVGTEYNTGMFKVTQNYLSGKTEDVKEFTIAPKTVELIGENTVTITTATKSCTVKVTGLSANTGKKAVMQKITAVYVGAQPTVDDKVDAKLFNVTAEYSDNTKRTLPVEEFTITPEKYTSAGTFYVRIESNGLVANPSVNVKAVAVTPAPTPAPTPRPTPRPTPAPTPAPTAAPRPNSSTSATTTAKPSQGNTASTSNKNNNSSNKNNNSSDEEKLASPLYIGGATIMTQTFGESNATPKENTVDIMQLIKNTSKDADSVTVHLINGRERNDITPAMFKELRKKKLVLYIEMLDPEDTDDIVARWTINTAAMDSDTASVNPNITFETITKESDKVLKMDITASNYPKGTTLTIYPDLYTYGSGQTIRLYETTAQGQVNTLKSTFTWLDTVNKIPVDVYSCYHYALSDATSTYNLSDNLLEEIVKPIEEKPVETPTAEGDITIGGPPSDEPEWDWDATPEPVINPESKGFPWLLVLLIGGGVALIGCAIIVIIVVSNKKKSKPIQAGNFSEELDYSNEDEDVVMDDTWGSSSEDDDEGYDE